MPAPAPISCFGCRHFGVTHDPAWPYACAHFAIRSRRLPSLEVDATCGEPCAAREGREAQVADPGHGTTGRG